MTKVLLAGRRLPHGDWEGDDATPGAGGKYVTCTDTATGRALCYATNGRIDLDGREIRAAVRPRDSDGINLRQAKEAVETLTSTTMILPQHWGWTEALLHLRDRRGLVVQGWYAAIPRTWRYQLKADFGHAIWISHFSPSSGMRVWDALDANTTHHGQWVPAKHIRAFAEDLAKREHSSGLLVGYVPLRHL